MSITPIRRSLLVAVGLFAAACLPERDAPPPAHDAGPALPPALDAGPPATPADAGCVPTCGARTCGDDGCGGVCGTCAEGSFCMGGACLASCPANARLSGDACVCNTGYAPNVACTSCVDDPDGDGCAEHAWEIDGRCVCRPHFRPEGCGCVEDPSDPPPPPSPCAAGETECGGGCLADTDGDGCPAHAWDLLGGGCACREGYAMSDDGCACEPLPSFSAEAFDPASCEGTAMTYADAEARWSAGDGTLGSYQMVFRRRSCEDGACGPWVEIPLTDIPWATRASGIAKIVSSSGALRLYIQNATCEHHHYLYDTRYNIGASCSGIGATLTCDSYHYPGICEYDSSPGMAYPLLSQALRFNGTMTDACLRLSADVSTPSSEAQAAILVRY